MSTVLESSVVSPAKNAERVQKELFVGTTQSFEERRVIRHIKKARLLVDTQVIFVNRYYFPDVSATSQILHDLTRRLVKQGVKVSVVCSRQLYGDAKASLPEFEEIDGVCVHRVCTTSFGRDRLRGRAFDYLSFYLTAAYKLLEITRPGDIVVAKTDPPMISVVAGAVAKWRGARLVNWLQDLFPEVASHLGHKMPGWLDGYLRRLRDQSLKIADKNVVIGTRMKELVTSRRVDPSRIEVIENWSDFVEPKPVSESRLRTELGLQDKFVIGYSGNLGRAHEFDTILDAASGLRHESDVAFLMIGAGAKMQQLKDAVTARGLTNFRFLPYQPREALADSMAASDVHLTSLLPSLEGLIVPSKFYGILAAARPAIVIGDEDGELARIVRKEQCGGVVRTGDADALISEIWHMKVDEEYRYRLGVRARTLFVERYTADAGAEKWVETIEAVLSEVTADKVPSMI